MTITHGFSIEIQVLHLRNYYAFFLKKRIIHMISLYAEGAVLN